LMTATDDDGNPAFAPDYADEILSGSCVTQGGRIVHEPTREAIEGPAAETPEPVEAAEAGEVVRIGNAQVWGGLNVPAQMPGPSSKLYAQNIVNIVTLMTIKADDEGGAATFAPDFDDEIVAGACVTHDGAIRHEPTREAIEGPAPEPPPEPDPQSDPERETASADLPYDQEEDR